MKTKSNTKDSKIGCFIHIIHKTVFLFHKPTGNSEWYFKIKNIYAFKILLHYLYRGAYKWILTILSYVTILCLQWEDHIEEFAYVAFS